MTGSKQFKHDMNMMFALHDALRRELDQLARITAAGGDEPRRVLRSAAGWEIFKGSLHTHHTAEDIALWPGMSAALADRPDDLALLAAMEAEHAAIDPLIEAIDAAAAEPAEGHESLAGLTDALGTALRSHLRHEEDEALALIDVTVTDEQWVQFGALHGKGMAQDISRVMPWMLDGADPSRAAAILAALPEPVRLGYENQWKVAYDAFDLWGAA